MVKRFSMRVRRVPTPLKFVFIVGTMLLIFGAISYIPYKHNQDKIKKQLLSDTIKRFGKSGTAESSVHNYYSQQAPILGLSSNDYNPTKTCYGYQPVGGGPGGPSKPLLWCGVSISKKIPTPRDITKATALIDSLKKVTSAEGMTTNGANDNSSNSQISYVVGKWGLLSLGEYSCITEVTSQYGAQDLLYYELKCSAQASYIPAGYIYLN